jgi:hypothetical protein
MTNTSEVENESSSYRVSGCMKFLFTLKKQYICVIAFFLIYLIIGISVYKDYGVSWDEPTHRQIAMVTVKYLASIFMPGYQPAEFTSLPLLAEYSAKQYGVVFDLPMYFAEVLLGYKSAMPEIYYMRHLCTFLLFYISVIFFFLIVKNRFESWLLGLTGCLFLILSPRIFADSFYGKDVVFLSLSILSIYFFIRYLTNEKLINSILFALATALMVGQRITGIFIPFLAVFMTVIDMVKTEKPFHNFPRKLFPLFIYLISFFIFMVLFWPFLWDDPLGNFINALTVMNKFPVTYDILYFGTFIKSTQVPWHYIPVWIIITTPLIYTFFFFFGSFWIIKVIIEKGLYSNDNERQDFLFLLLFITPLIAVILFNSALYDGWRHVYFIYVSFLLIAMTGFAKVLIIMKNGRTGRELCATAFIAAVIIFGIITTSYQMIKNHPFQNVYFNILAGRNAGQNFELDYWGLSFRRGLEYIVKNDKRPVIKLTANIPQICMNNAIFLEKHDISRLQLVSINEADYFLTNYRWHPESYPLNQEVFTIIVDNQKIMSVFKVR